ncbi:hypothetical protein [Alicyclobacillus dauci]|uniref:Uncharacterized protein n=1 Tax=Alicyclobacillus dauci TaxID=1475485 RepID=A0ABY6YXM1_9BACL|nr:hypothetical protein [Alicyclobacillus dauci]WAH35348.1 hypothetical protein NZD86_13680 [Alicyclobacillus dauci]
MKDKVQTRRPWQFYVVTGALLLGVFAWVDGKLFSAIPNSFGTGTSSKAAPTSSDPDPSDAMIDDLTNHLGNVNGLNDMVVLPDGKGQGQYVVSAIVDLSEATDGQTSNPGVTQEISALVDAYYRDIYSTNEPVSEAEITFMQGDSIVGSSGLGRDAYEKMATTTMNGDLASTLVSSSPVQNDNSQDAWLEIQQ